MSFIWASLPSRARMLQWAARYAYDPEDAVQQALIALWQHGDQIRHPTTWVFGAIRFAGMHQRRAATRRASYQVQWGMLACGEFDPTERYEARDLLRQIAYSPENAVCVDAAVDDVPRDARNRLCRGRQRLRRVYGR